MEVTSKSPERYQTDTCNSANNLRVAPVGLQINNLLKLTKILLGIPRPDVVKGILLWFEGSPLNHISIPTPIKKAPDRPGKFLTQESANDLNLLLFTYKDTLLALRSNGFPRLTTISNVKSAILSDRRMWCKFAIEELIEGASQGLELGAMPFTTELCWILQYIGTYYNSQHDQSHKLLPGHSHYGLDLKCLQVGHVRCFELDAKSIQHSRLANLIILVIVDPERLCGYFGRSLSFHATDMTAQEQICKKKVSEMIEYAPQSLRVILAGPFLIWIEREKNSRDVMRAWDFGDAVFDNQQARNMKAKLTQADRNFISRAKKEHEEFKEPWRQQDTFPLFKGSELQWKSWWVIRRKETLDATAVEDNSCTLV